MATLVEATTVGHRSHGNPGGFHPGRIGTDIDRSSTGVSHCGVVWSSSGDFSRMAIDSVARNDSVCCDRRRSRLPFCAKQSNTLVLDYSGRSPRHGVLDHELFRVQTLR